MSDRSALALLPILAIAACRSSPPAAPAGTSPAARPTTSRSTSDATPPAASDAPTGALPDGVAPKAVALSLRIDPARDDFDGAVAIDVALARPTDTIWLHARGLTIARVRATVAGVTRDLAWTVVDDREVLGVRDGARLPAGTVRLSIEYRGRLDRDDVGLFKHTMGGRAFVYSDFEPVDARRAFPCFDEPRFKPTWRLTIEAPNGLRAFANAPRTGGRTTATTAVHEFAPTRPMSSYLVAIAVGPFDHLPAPTDRRVGVVTPPGWPPADRALSSAPRLLAAAEAMFGEPMPYPKLDLAAVREMPGAMENPGLITVGAHILLPDLDRASADAVRSAQEGLDGVLAHEISHLWLGDLVSPASWRETWLNEGMATWASERLLAAIDPTALDQVIDVADKGLALDADHRRGSGPILRDRIDRGSAERGFDVLAYRKGGAILWMLEAWLGPERMLAGVRDYVAGHRDGTATSRDLATALDRVAPIAGGAGRVLDGFLSREGLPIVDVELDCHAAPTVVIRQRPYRRLIDRDAADVALPPWSVPVCVAPVGGPVQCTLLETPEGRLSLTGARCPVALQPNPGERGYYVAAMPPRLLAALTRSSTMTSRERVGLRRAIGLLLEAGAIDLDAAVAAASALPVTTDLEASELATLAEHLDAVAAVPHARRAIRSRLARVLAPVAERYRIEAAAGEPRARILARLATWQALGTGASTASKAAARDHALEWIAGRRELIAGDASLLVAGIEADGPTFERLLAAARSDSPARALPAATALGAVRADALIERAVALCRGTELAAPARQKLLEALADNPAARARLFDDLAGDDGWIDRVAPRDRVRGLAVLAGGCAPRERDTLARAARRLADPSAAPLVDALVDRIDSCSAERERYAREASALR